MTNTSGKPATETPEPRAVKRWKLIDGPKRIPASHRQDQNACWQATLEREDSTPEKPQIKVLERPDHHEGCMALKAEITKLTGAQ